MKVSAGSLLSFAALAASAAAVQPQMAVEDIPHLSTKEYLKEAGFYDGKLDHYMRRLKAAVRRSDLGKRDDGIKVLNDIELLYAEHENEYGVYGGKSVHRTSLSGPTKDPVLMIERFDNHIDSVKCADKTIKLNFNNPASFKEAVETTKNSEGYTIITSHPGCQEEDERRPFKIESVKTNEDAMQVSFEVSKRSFKQVFKTMGFEYGESDEPHVLRKNVRREQEKLAKRTYTPTWTYPSMSLSAGVPSGTPGADHGSTDLHWEVKDEGFTLPNIVTDHLAAAVEVGCNDCSQDGTATFSQGKFEFDFDIDWSDFDVDVFKGGWVQLDINDYKLHMDMYAIPSGSVYYWKDLVQIPFPGAGYIVPGIGKLGIFFSPAISASMTITSPIKFNYGFDVTMPDSSVKVDFGNMDGEINGFDVQVDALPFTANDTDPSLSISGVFMPRIPIGFEFGDADGDGNLPSGGISASVGIFASTPQITWTFTPGCGDNSTALAIRDEGALINIAPTIKIGAGFDLSANVRIEGINPAIFTRVTLMSTEWALPTACYSVDLAAGSWSSVESVATPQAARIVRKEPLPTPVAQITEAPAMAKRAIPFSH
jgi:hypothetical protein